MPFEAGLAVAIARSRPDHQWFLLEARAHRMQKSLSDLSGTDPYIHRNSPRQLLVALTDALVRVSKQPTLGELDEIFQLLSAEAVEIRRSYGTLFGASSSWRSTSRRGSIRRPRGNHCGSGGRRWAHGRSASKAAAARSTSASSSRRPTICSPTGRPLAVQPAGTETAGWPL